MKRFGILIVLALLAVTSVVIYACREGRWRHGQDMRYGRDMMERPGFPSGERGPLGALLDPAAGLHLSKGQREKLAGIVTGMQDKMLPLKLEEQKKRIELSEMLLVSNPDKAALSAKLAEMLKLKGQEQEAMLNAYFDVSAVLTPPQKRELSRLVIQKLMEHGKRI